MTPIVSGHTTGPSVFSRPRRTVSLLDVDPDLAALIEPAALPAATVAARAEVVVLGRGDWDVPAPEQPAIGLVLLSGLVARIVRVGRRESLELLGPGDIIRPWDEELESIVACETRWEVLEPATAALLDGRFARTVAPWPQLSAALCGRAVRRSRWLAVQSAIDSHPTVEERLMLMFCHLGERMGRVCPDGIVLDLPLSHRLVACAVRALRPSVTSGLLRLRDDGRLAQRGRRQWVITHAGLENVSGLCGQDVIDC